MMDDILFRAEVLHKESRDSGKKELRKIIDELYELVGELERRKPLNGDLAESICAFAEWHNARYSEVDRGGLDVVGEQLWSEVCDNVRSIIGYMPATAAARP